MGIADGTDGDLCATGGGIAFYTNIAQMLTFINTTNVPDLGQILLPSAQSRSGDDHAGSRRAGGRGGQ